MIVKGVINVEVVIEGVGSKQNKIKCLATNGVRCVPSLTIDHSDYGGCSRVR